MLLEREVEILKHLQHPHIIHLVEIFDSSKVKFVPIIFLHHKVFSKQAFYDVLLQKMYLVLELCKGGELLTLLKAKGYFTQEVY